MKILAIETSCDETSVAVVDGEKISDTQARFEVKSHVLHSQIEDHRVFGGVYPNVARREHAKHLIPLLKKALYQSSQEHQYNLDSKVLQKVYDWLQREPELANQLIKFATLIKPNKLDAIAVTAGPGLAPALWIGINVARSLAALWDIPLVAVNHMAGHVHSALFSNKELELPALGLLVSGGHTEIIKINSPVSFEKVGWTVDDAAGEAFDKVARLLGLPYPGGPEISKLAAKHRADYPNFDHQFNLPLPMQYSGDLNFSFSGLKTASKKIIDKNELTKKFVSQFSREFEETVAEILILKLDKAITKYQPKQILCGGGVIANQHLRNALQDLINKRGKSILFPTPQLYGDNAIMIAMAGFWQVDQKSFVDPINIVAKSNWSIAMD
jgi:N6-L-threonylcarbamoyladenine synthase